MESVVNRRGLRISVGSLVRYLNTGTTGVVTSMETIDGRCWALVEPINLCYDVDYLEPLGEADTDMKDKVSKVKVDVGKTLKEEEDVIERSTEVSPSGAG
ncbi:MAG: DUF2098 family protein [Candidatus Nezhaarchaeota archaeon]|nr:DUF2098 family protein [Candidatus Nezhaarchaeota archaeon]